MLVGRSTVRLASQVHGYIRTYKQGLTSLRCRYSDYIRGMPNQASKNKTSFKVDVDGVRLHYETVGSGSEVLLLMPGALGSSKTDYEYQMENLNKDLFTLIAFDPPGYGLSQAPKRDGGAPYDFLRTNAWYATRLMQNLKVPTYSLLGWSSGATSAMMMAAEHEDRIQKLIILASQAYVTEPELKVIRKFKNIDNWGPYMRAQFEKVYSTETLCKLSGDWIEKYQKYMTFNQGDLCSEDLKNIKCPTLIIHGQKDIFIGQTQANYLQANIQHSKLVMFPDGNHNLHMRYHKMFNSLVERFITNPASISKISVIWLCKYEWERL